MESPIICDILVVGGGATGMTAAAIASTFGLNTIVAEKQDTLGGTALLSGGTIWIPNNSLAKGNGVRDGFLLGQEYLKHALKHTNEQEALSGAVMTSFLENGPKMVSYLEAEGFRWHPRPSKFPDYQPFFPGGLSEGGPTLDPATFDAKLLGTWKQYLSIPKLSLRLTRFEEFRISSKPLASPWDFLMVCGFMLRSLFLGLLYGSPVTMGCSLVAQLLHICQRNRHVEIRTSTSLVELLTEHDKVVGAVLECGGTRTYVRARCGVLLAAAGFAQNEQMRREHLPRPTSTTWSLTRAGGDSGDVLMAAKAIGAKCCALQETWGIPTMTDPRTGLTTNALFELATPHGIVINKSGYRFANESQPYGDFVHSMYESKGGTVPAWPVVDSQYLRKYTLGSLKPWDRTESAVRCGRLVKAAALRELSEKLLLPRGNLERTIERWNTMCQVGDDLDFGRGSDAYQRFIGDASARPNPAMGSINKPPFFAIQIYPGDAGTKGGLVTDSCARVMRQDGKPIGGLYAAGNIAASLFGKTSLGAGVTIGPAMTFAFVAVHCMAKSASAPDCSARKQQTTM
ncbi:hypothetical protein PCL_08367 [Purpureocillium lilacinum]|uniref:FAD-dependent oxidoreductase 2 FAD-binding domain-containing protein n=1 Tax=Purpureocillium lilacinum TaxID=33203 RepID=A0A2U3DRX4_PURLI|nr:hypothetical protein PCL_08367 [Purpureocillium lilacinum]